MHRRALVLSNLLSCKRSFSHLQSVLCFEGNAWQNLTRLAVRAGSSTTAFKPSACAC